MDVPISRRDLLARGGILTLAATAAPAAWAAAPARASDGPERYGAGSLVYWFGALTGAVAAEGLSPPVASRLYAYAAVATHEAIAPASTRVRPLAGRLNGLPALPRPPAGVPYDWSQAASAASAVVARGLLADASAATRRALEDAAAAVRARRAGAGATGLTLARSTRYGEAVGRAVLTWADRDGLAAARALPRYAPPAGPGLWVPTPPAF